MDIQALNNNFGRNKTIEFQSGPGDQQYVILRHASGHSAKIFLFGAHAVSWTTPSGDDLFFLSKKSDLTGAKPIRGGIPLVFPQFGSGTLPAHGFARTSKWSVVETDLSPKGEVVVSLELAANEETSKLWPHSFVARITFILSSSLGTTFEVRNTGNAAFDFQNALHTYFAVGDIHKVEVHGLKGLNFLDSTKKRELSQETRSIVTFEKETDRIYLEAPDTIRILDHSKQRTFSIFKKHFQDAVVWNPWIERTKSIADLEADDYVRYVCVEVGNVEPKIHLEPGKSFTSKQELKYES